MENAWYEKYAPKYIEDVIMPANIKSALINYIKNENLPCYGFWSDVPGLGKSCTAQAIIRSMNAEALFLNASLEKGIDVLRSTVKQFASSCSLSDRPKIVVMDEADYLTPDAQAAFRGFMDKFDENCTFIFTGNYKTRIIPPVISRLQNIDFADFDKREMVPAIRQRLVDILEKENFQMNENTERNIAEIIKAQYPSIRGMIGALQKAVCEGNFEVQIETSNYGNVVELLRSADYLTLIQETNALANPDSMFEYLFKRIEIFKNAPQAICVLAKYQYQSAFARDKHLNLCACLTELKLCL